MRVHGLIALAASLGVVSGALAQQPTTGTLESLVTHDAKPLAGASVTVVGPLGERAASTDGSGRIEMRLLPSGTYTVRVEMTGFGTVEVQGVTVTAGERTRLPIAMTAGMVEEVEVTSVAPLVDMTLTEVTTTFRIDDVISTLPVGRRFTDIVALAPGVVSGLGTGEENHSISGSTGLENSYIVDGVNITDSGFGNVGTGIFGRTFATGVTTDFLEELQVKTAGFEAEYGQALGGVINGVVKSGSNDFTGAVRLFYQPADWEAQGEDVVREGGATNFGERQEFDYGLQAGGPFVKDRLFWFVAFNPVQFQQEVTREASTASNPVLAQDPGASQTYPFARLQPGAASGGLEDDQDTYNYAAKLTWQVTPRQRVELTGFGDHSNGTGGLGEGASYPFNLAEDVDDDGAIDVTRTAAGFFEGALQSRLTYGADQQSLKYSGVFGADWLVEGQLSHRRSRFEENPELDDYIFIDIRPFLETGVEFFPVGGGGLESNSNDETWDFALKIGRIFGRHEVKAGFEYWDAEYEERSQVGRTVDFPFPIDTDGDGAVDSVSTIESSTGAEVFVLGGIPGCTTCSSEIPYYQSNLVRLNPTEPTTSEEYSFFLQDTWAIGRRWVAKLGARTVRQSLEGSSDFTLNLTQVGPGVFTSEPTRFKPLSYSFETEIAPRLGLTFDPRADGRTKLYANYARYFERVPQAVAVHTFSNDVFVSGFEFRDPDLTVWRGTPIAVFGLNPTRVEEGTQLPYVDEFVVGWQQLLRSDLTLEVRAIYRDQGRVLEDVQSTAVEEVLNFFGGLDAAGNPPFPGFGSAPPSRYVLANPGENTPANVDFPFSEPEREYRAIELVLNKHLSNGWQLMANYRYSRLWGNYEGLFRNDNHQPAPNATTLLDFPNSPLTRGQFESGRLNTDRPHVLHVLGTYFFDGGFELGGGLHVQSGVLRTPLLAHPIYQIANEIPGTDPVYLSIDPLTGLWTRGSSGFFLADYDQASRGSLGRSPATTTLDAHAGWERPLPGTSLKVALDVFNLFNSQDEVLFDDAVELRPATPNPNFGVATSFQRPRSIRIATTWAW